MIIYEEERLIITSSTDGLVKVFDMEYLRLKETLKGNGNDIKILLLNPDNKTVAFSDG